MSAAPIRVGVAGAHGRLGRAACDAIAAADGLELIAGLVRERAPGQLSSFALYEEPAAFYAAGLDVVVDCTVYPASIDVVRAAIDARVAPVIGATGWSDEDLVSIADRCDEMGVAALVVPNFSIGAALMMRFATEAASFYGRVEIVERHHDRKRDAPSGTAALTAARIRDAGGPADVPIHSVRLPGSTAHQDTIFGGEGETLTIRHDALGPSAYAAGIVLAVRRVRQLHGLMTGLDTILFQPSSA